MERELLTPRDTEYALHGQKYWDKRPLLLPRKGTQHRACGVDGRLRVGCRLGPRQADFLFFNSWEWEFFKTYVFIYSTMSGLS